MKPSLSGYKQDCQRWSVQSAGLTGTCVVGQGHGCFYCDVVFVLRQPVILAALCAAKESELSTGKISLPRVKKITLNF